jgi:hypothetical protein
MMKTAQNKPQPPNLENSIVKGQLAAVGLKIPLGIYLKLVKVT